MDINLAKERIIVQVPSHWVRGLNDLEKIVTTLKDHVGFFYIGSGLLTDFGPTHAAKLIHSWGGKSFLALDLDDSVLEINRALNVCRKSKINIVSVSTTIGKDYLKDIADAAKIREPWEEEKEAHKTLIFANLLPRFLEGVQASTIFGRSARYMAGQFASWAKDAELDGMLFSSTYLDMFRNGSYADLCKVVFDVRLNNDKPKPGRHSIPVGQAAKIGADMFLVCHPIINREDGQPSVEAAQQMAIEIAASMPEKMTKKCLAA